MSSPAFSLKKTWNMHRTVTVIASWSKVSLVMHKFIVNWKGQKEKQSENWSQGYNHTSLTQ